MIDSVNHTEFDGPEPCPYFQFWLWRLLQQAKTMNASWHFLTPWYAALYRQLVEWWGPESVFPALRASWLTPSDPDTSQVGVLFVIKVSYGDRVQWQRLRESVEIFLPRDDQQCRIHQVDGELYGA